MTVTVPLRELGDRYLFQQFTPLGKESRDAIKIIVRGEGCYVFDSEGHSYLDAASGHFCVNVGHGRPEFAEAASAQFAQIAYWSNWGYASPPAILLASRLAEIAPGDLNRTFLTSGGSEAVESALKLARQFHRLAGEGSRTKVISRINAYHGTSLGALAATGVTSARSPFEPVVPGGSHIPSAVSDIARGHPYLPAPASLIEDQILFEGAETVAAVILEPMQNIGGCLEPQPGYFAAVREICDRYGVLLISDEVICAWGRLGHLLGGSRYDIQPDIITLAKGLASGYAPIGAMVVSDRVVQPFIDSNVTFSHGFTYGGHPVAAALALENLNVLEREALCERVLALEPRFKAMLEGLSDIPIVRETRGAGYFWAIELLKDPESQTPFDPDEGRRIVRDFLDPELKKRGVICRPDNRAGVVIQLAPPLIAGEAEFGEIEARLREVLSELASRVRGRRGFDA